MPSARADEFRRAAAKLGFRRVRQEGSHERWIHDDGRSTTIPIHGGKEIGGSLFYRILKQLGVNLEAFDRLR
jgi:predicted RNA binding protein YcfA (HicA-like mRNA interferase family)